MGKDTCGQVWWPELNSQDLRQKERLTLQAFLWLLCTCIGIHLPLPKINIYFKCKWKIDELGSNRAGCIWAFDLVTLEAETSIAASSHHHQATLTCLTQCWLIILTMATDIIKHQKQLEIPNLISQPILAFVWIIPSRQPHALSLSSIFAYTYCLRVNNL